MIQQYLGIVLLLAVSSGIATLVYILVKKREGNIGTIVNCMKRYTFHVFSFFFSAFFFVISVVKYYLGYHKENIFESFWNVQAITYVHYGIPLIIMAFIAPFVLFFVFRKYEWKMIRFFDSVIFFTLAFVYFFVRKINNKTYCIAFLIAVVFTAIMILYIRKNDILFVSQGNIKKKSIEILPFILYWVVLIAFYTPNELYLNNASDFPMSYWYFFGKLLCGCIIISGLLFGGVLLYLSEKQKDIFGVILFVFLTMGYIQGMFLNGDMGTLDGSQHTWDISQQILNLLLWCVFVLGCGGLFLWKRKQVMKIMRIICIWIALTQLVSLGILIISSDGTEAKSELLLTTDGILEVGEENNVIIFVLDMFDGCKMDKILERDADFLEPLKDFTYYRNATSEFCPTNNSIPFLLTGTKFQEEQQERYVTYAYEGNTLLADIKARGYDVGIYTNSIFVSEEMQELISNYKGGITRTCKLWDLFSLMTQCSRYSMAPLLFKNYYIYDTSDIALLVVDDRIVNIEDDIPLYRNLTNNGLYISEDTERKGTFRFIHMHGAHPPYTMTEEFQYIEYDARRDKSQNRDGISQAKGAMKIVYEYIRQLKELGKYDETTIVITADHGSTSGILDVSGNVADVSVPILFVKKANESKEEMVVNEAPVCHADIITTIRAEIGMDISEKTLSDYSENEERVRYFKYCGLDWFEKYEVRGNVREFSSWKKVGEGGIRK